VEERHQHEVRGDLVVRRGAEERLAVLAPEVEEGARSRSLSRLALGGEPGRLDLRERVAIAVPASERGMTSR
jgi:hypothetical protein